MGKPKPIQGDLVVGACFSTVLAIDAQGRVLESQGTPVGIENALDDPRLGHLRDSIEALVVGLRFEAVLPMPQGNVRLIGAPATGGGAVRGYLCFGFALDDKRERKRSQRAVAEFEFLLNNMRQGYWRLDSKGKIIAANRYMASWLETNLESLLGRYANDFIGPAIYDEDKGLEGGHRFEAEFTTATGLVKKAIVATIPMYGPKGRFIGTIDVVTDVTAEHVIQSKLVQEVQRMQGLAHTDPLTGLANRMVFDDRLDQLSKAAQERPFALLLCDLDDFKNINDTYGHQAGDRALVEFAGRLKSGLRDGDLVARIGGDEFAVLLPGAPKELASDIVQRIANRLRFSFEHEGKALTAQASIGWAHSEDGPWAVLGNADRDLYRSKRAALP